MLIWELLTVIVPIAAHFVKDLSMDRHEFPPLVEQRSKGLPAGHLRPLGYQRAADGRIKAFKVSIGPETFLEKAVADGRPMLIKDFYSPIAIKKWDDEYLTKNFGHLQISARVKVGKNSTVQTLSLREYIRKFHYEDYNIMNQPLPEELKPDLLQTPHHENSQVSFHVPKFFTCPRLRYELCRTDWFLNAGMAASDVFKRGNNQIHCTMSGRADFIVMEGKYAGAFGMVEDIPHSGDAECVADTEMVNMYQNKIIGDVPWKWGILREKDCIYVPAGMLQKVRTFGNYLGITLLFSPLDAYGSCTEDDIKRDILLNTVNSFTTFVGGNITYGQAPWNIEKLTTAFKFLMHNTDRLYMEQWIDFYTHSSKPPNSKPQDPVAAFEDGFNMWKDLFDKKLTGSISKTALSEIPSEKKQWIVRKLNGADERRYYERPKDEL